MVQVFEKKSTHCHTSLIENHMVECAKKNQYYFILDACTRKCNESKW